MWQQTVGPFLHGGSGLLPLATLCRMPHDKPLAEALGEVVREIDKRLIHEVSANNRTGNLAEARPTLPEIDHARQQEIEELRAQYQQQFDRIEDKTPSLDELLSMTVEPPSEWLNER